jgi:hypothetical protein
MADHICATLTFHARADEVIFYPAVRKAVSKGKDMVNEATVEHASFIQLIAQIFSMFAVEDLFDAKGKLLSGQIDHHAGEDEDEMFMIARKSKFDLLSLGQEITDRKEALAAFSPDIRKHALF